MNLTHRAAALLAAATLCLTVGTTGVAGPAHADDQTPAADRSGAPVTADDTVSVQSGSAVLVPVLANDSDPDDSSAGDGGLGDLAVCRATAPYAFGGPNSYQVAPVDPDQTSGPVLVAGRRGSGSGSAGSTGSTVATMVGIAAHGVRPGTYQITYWACDRQFLTPGTLTVTVTPEPRFAVTAHKVAGRPGVVRFRDTGEVAAEVLYGGVKAHRPDGRLRLAPGAHRDVRVHRTSVRWVAFHSSGPGSDQYSEGIVRGIRLTAQHGAARPSASLRWAQPAPGRGTAAARTAPWARPTTNGTANGTAARRTATTADHVRVGRGYATVVDVLANDPANGSWGPVIACRTDVPAGSRVVATPADYQSGALYVTSGRGATTGVHQLTYYACDGDTLTPGTLSVDVVKIAKVVAHAVAGRPGLVRFHNPGTFRVQVLVLSGRRHQIVDLRPGGTRTVRVQTTSIQWAAYSRYGTAGQGTVRHIRLP